MFFPSGKTRRPYSPPLCVGQGIAHSTPEDTFHGGKVLRFALFFSLGVLVFHQLSWLPDWRWVLLEISMMLGWILVWRGGW